MWKDKSRQFTFDLLPNYIYFNSLKLDTEKSQIIRPKFFTFFVYNFFFVLYYMINLVILSNVLLTISILEKKI